MIVSQLKLGAAYALTDVALVSGSSLIYGPRIDRGFAPFPFNPAEEFLQDEVMSRMTRSLVGDRLDFQFEHPVQVVGHLRQDAVPLNLMHAHNYYHFLIEALPNLVFLQARDMIGPNSVIVSGMLHPNMWSALHFAMSGSEMAVFQLRRMQAVTCDKVVTAQPASHAAQLLKGGTTDWEYHPLKLRALRERFGPLRAAAAGEPRRKIYVRRISRVRSLTNTNWVEAIVRDAGYEIVQPEQMDFHEQVKLFAQASHIMGPTGAWAANLLFAPTDAVIHVFYPETARTARTVWGALAEALGMKAHDVYGPVTRLHEAFPIHSDFEVPPDQLHEILNHKA